MAERALTEPVDECRPAITNMNVQTTSSFITMLFPELHYLIALTFLDPASRVMLSISCRHMNQTLGLTQRKEPRTVHILTVARAAGELDLVDFLRTWPGMEDRRIWARDIRRLSHLAKR